MPHHARPLSRINGVNLHVPASFDGILPVSPCDADYPFEAYCWMALQALIEPGDVVYDIGASYGILSALMARAGAEVHAFEANPDVIPQTRELLDGNNLTVTLNQCCVGECSGGDVEFHLAPGLSSAASSRHAVVSEAFVNARTVRVPMEALDNYARRQGHTPRSMKIDVEGSEYMVLLGARELIRRSHPCLVLETHPPQMIGTTLPGFLEHVEASGYPLFDLLSGEMTGAGEFAARHPTLPGYVLASLRLNDPQFLAGLRERHAAVHARWEHRTRHAGAMQRARKLMESEAPEAIAILREVIAESPMHAEAHYLLAWRMHTSHQESELALVHYELALEHGFDPFWVLYNRGALLFDMGRPEDARSHLDRAHALKPEHEGVAFYLKELSR